MRKYRACGHTKFEHSSKVSSAITFYSIIVAMAMKLSVCSQLVWLCNTDYRMEIFYFSNKICLIKQQSTLCPHIPSFHRPGHI